MVALGLVACLMVGLAVAGALVWNRIQEVDRTVYGPDVVALRYAQLLVAGDVESAARMVEPILPEGASGKLLTNAAVAQVEGRPTAAHVSGTTVDGETATVTVAYTGGQAPDTVDYTLKLTGKTDMLFDTWELQPPHLDSFRVTCTTPGTVLVAGVDVSDLLADGGTAELAAVDGTYSVTYSDPQEFFGSETRTVLVTAGVSESGADLRPDISETLIDRIQAETEDQVTAMAKKCAASKLLGSTCPPDWREIGKDAEGLPIKFEIDGPVSVWVIPRDTFPWTYTAMVTVRAEGVTAKKKTVTASEILAFGGTVTREENGRFRVTQDF